MKNAILIVECGKDLMVREHDAFEVVVEAAKLRLRPTIVSSLGFIGVLPLAIATGAGSATKNAIGIGVMGGINSATILGASFVPLLFVNIAWLNAKLRGREPQTAEA